VQTGLVGSLPDQRRQGCWQPSAIAARFHGASETPVQIRLRRTSFHDLGARRPPVRQNRPRFQGATMVHYDVDMASASRTGSSERCASPTLSNALPLRYR